MCKWWDKLEKLTPGLDMGMGVLMTAVVLGSLALFTVMDARADRNLLTEGRDAAIIELRQFNEDEMNYAFSKAWPICLELAEGLDSGAEEYSPYNEYKFGMCIGLAEEMKRRKLLRTI